MIAYTLYLGLTDRNGNPVPREVETAVLTLTARTFGGYTLTRADGGYCNDAGELVTESSLRIEVVTDLPELTVYTWAGKLRYLANQESVLLTSHNLNRAEFIGDNQIRKVA
jgi:hypothetical protein